ncbi:MAG: SusD/RagB family nutrient-binding outer membrane lipoprotein [Capnocytophaga sp.]|nr:SusD/RagB family nutrient-binding outer membrane lipoprotein [Capnocytophaga sp.]
MKLFHRKNIVLLMSSAFVLLSCTSDFEDINKNPLLPDDHQKTLDGLASVGLFPGFIANIVPTATGSGTSAQNNYQVTSNMTGDVWSGYMGVGTQWDGGTSTPNLFIKENRRTGIFSVMLENAINPFMEIKAATHNVTLVGGERVYTPRDLTSQANFAVAQIIKVMGIHRLTDLYGPIPYSKIGAGKLQAPYDSQEQVYRLMLQELHESVTKLVEYKNAGGTTILKNNDPLYQGNTEKWIRFGNSLMLRLAIRVRYADVALAQTYITYATSAISGGLMETNDHTAKLETNGTFRFFNSIYTLRTYTEANAGANLLSYLEGYNDARKEVYFTKGNYNGTDGYYGVRMGVRKPKADYENYSELNIVEATPTYWFKASEVQFLLAEARLFNLISTGTAEEYYNKGIELSFSENNLSAGTYATTSAKPAKYTDPRDSDHNAEAVSTIDKKWSSVSTDEEHLEQIITQKYIANFPIGLEAWSEWRRTGYPRMFKEVVNLTNVNAVSISADGKNGGIRRVPFSLDEYQLNSENMPAAVSLLGGADNAATNVWWDKKSK